MALLAPIWCEVASEVASCVLPAFWSAYCTAEPPLEPPADWSADWSVLFLLPAADTADELLTCVTEPSSPDEPMRTGTLTLLGWSCTDVADERADWSL